VLLSLLPVSKPYIIEECRIFKGCLP
jgi:hypothetical protein